MYLKKWYEFWRRDTKESINDDGALKAEHIEDLLLTTLEYPREYRTYAHITASYDVAESNIYWEIRCVEDTLIKDGTFSLPGRKELLKSDVEYEVILVDATKTPIGRALCE